MTKMFIVSCRKDIWSATEFSARFYNLSLKKRSGAAGVVSRWRLFRFRYRARILRSGGSARHHRSLTEPPGRQLQGCSLLARRIPLDRAGLVVYGTGACLTDAPAVHYARQDTRRADCRLQGHWRQPACVGNGAEGGQMAMGPAPPGGLPGGIVALDSAVTDV